MAKGLIERATLTAIADKIRAKTRTTTKMSPGDMAEMIESISNEVHSGSYTLVGNVNHQFNLGVSLPRYSSYIFMTYKMSGWADNHGGYNLVENGVVTEGMMASWSSSNGTEVYVVGSSDAANAAKAVITIDFDAGIISSPALNGSSGTWNWWYFEVKGASA